MSHPVRELFIVQIGGIMSMRVTVMDSTLKAHETPMSLAENYIRGFVCVLPSPERHVAIYVFMDNCATIRKAIFQTAVKCSMLIESCGDVHVAMQRLHEETEDPPLASDRISELELMLTVSKIGRQSRLCQRQTAKLNEI